VVDRQRDIIDHRQRSKSLGQAAQINGRQSSSSHIVAYSGRNTRAPLSAAYLSLDQYKHECMGAGKAC
jgi:hypothetical protein